MLYIALLHYPVFNKEGKIVTTAIANMDIHDIARIAKTYGVRAFYLINPDPSQRDLASKIIRHWQEGYGSTYNQSRRDAFELIRLKISLDDVITEIKAEAGYIPQTIVTGANLQNGLSSCAELKTILKTNDLPYLLIFGTGSGIAAEVINNAEYRLEPIKGAGVYNHLAVRSAVAIILDRLV